MKLLLLLLLTLSQVVFAQSPKQAYEAAKNKEVVLIDVREKDEVTAGMVDQAIWIAKSDIDNNGPQWQSFSKNAKNYKKVALYCRSGRRAGLLIEKFKSLGLDVENLGGLKDFESDGVKIVQPKI